MKVLLVKPAEKPKAIEIEDTLKNLQDAVEGSIQVIYPFNDNAALVCNDEGKICGLPFNRALRDSEGEIYDIIAGNFLIVGANIDDEDFSSLSDEQIIKYEKEFSLKY